MQSEKTKRPRSGSRGGVSQGCRRRPTLPRPLGRSTIGAVGLNDRVRDGNGCGPYALVASDLCRSIFIRTRSAEEAGGAARST